MHTLPDSYYIMKERVDNLFLRILRKRGKAFLTSIEKLEKNSKEFGKLPHPDSDIVLAMYCLIALTKSTGIESMDWSLQAGLCLSNAEAWCTGDSVAASMYEKTRVLHSSHMEVNEKLFAFVKRHSWSGQDTLRKYASSLAGKKRKGSRNVLRKAIEQLCDLLGKKANLKNVLSALEGNASDTILDTIHAEPFPIKIHNGMVDRDAGKLYCPGVNKKGNVSFKRVENIIAEYTPNPKKS